MDADAGAGAPDLTFPIEYQAGRDSNRELSGRGVLRIERTPRRFVFRGHVRRMMSRGPEIELAFLAEDVRNVAIGGRRVEFTSTKASTDAKRGPFVFFCASEEEAIAATRFFPATHDPEFVEGLAFQDQVARLAGPRGTMAWVTNLIVAANLIVFVAMGLLGAGWFEAASMKPYIFYGANNAAATTNGEWWRLVTSMFLHFGVLHVAFNMWALYQAGHLVERLLGRSLYTLVYFGTGVVGSLATICWHGDTLWSAGASGAVFGVYGALLGYFVREKHGVPRSVFQPIMKSTLIFAAFNLFYGAVNPHIDNAAHIGGFASGFVLGWLVALPLDLQQRAALWPRRFLAGVVVLAIAIAVGVHFAPRYNYLPTEEFAWDEATATAAASEKAIDEEERKAFTAYEQTHDAKALATWLGETGLPFYKNFRDRLAALQLTPGKLTALRRDWMTRMLDLEVEAYQQLKAGLTNDDVTAWANYKAKQSEILDVLHHPPQMPKEKAR
ncbi:rhomboid family intramembrane serine protease [Horticoccus luteus]|uniref:Rhomboid family intramembrane serine protease n=1 Tax=Horticoccus luteus TaxID=2862869 RepID=A0A8F9TSU0_9BACT|nr:rhomboid family intramembrane serine protease [Horticoccus luteus]QYM78584.1 rhomboid family intramembrane serine protease [Horticoccus luteus]